MTDHDYLKLYRKEYNKNGEEYLFNTYGIKLYELDNLERWHNRNVTSPTTFIEIDNASISQLIYWWRFLPQNQKNSKFITYICQRFNKMFKNVFWIRKSIPTITRQVY